MTSEIVEMLERKIEDLIAHCQDLARRNAGLTAELSEKERQIVELKGQLNSLMEERQEVSVRIERLISRIEEAAGEDDQEGGSAAEPSSSQDQGQGSDENTIQFPHS